MSGSWDPEESRLEAEAFMKRIPERVTEDDNEEASWSAQPSPRDPTAADLGAHAEDTSQNASQNKSQSAGAGSSSRPSPPDLKLNLTNLRLGAP